MSPVFYFDQTYESGWQNSHDGFYVSVNFFIIYYEYKREIIVLEIDICDPTDINEFSNY